MRGGAHPDPPRPALVLCRQPRNVVTGKGSLVCGLCGVGSHPLRASLEHARANCLTETGMVARRVSILHYPTILLRSACVLQTFSAASCLKGGGDLISRRRDNVWNRCTKGLGNFVSYSNGLHRLHSMCPVITLELSNCFSVKCHFGG